MILPSMVLSSLLYYRSDHTCAPTFWNRFGKFDRIILQQNHSDPEQGRLVEEGLFPFTIHNFFNLL